jgi:hypothetical protein
VCEHSCPPLPRARHTFRSIPQPGKFTNARVTDKSTLHARQCCWVQRTTWADDALTVLRIKQNPCCSSPLVVCFLLDQARYPQSACKQLALCQSKVTARMQQSARCACVVRLTFSLLESGNCRKVQEMCWQEQTVPRRRSKVLLQKLQQMHSQKSRQRFLPTQIPAKTQRLGWQRLRMCAFLVNHRPN